MFFVHLVIVSIIFVGILISNVLTILLIGLAVFRDEYSNPQGVDYYIFSLAVSDLLLGIFLIPFSLVSLSMQKWIFGEDICEFYAYLWYSLWLINIYTFFLLSVDRYLYLTDRKYVQYKSRTRVRCICEIFLAWSVALSYSFVPASLHSARLSAMLINQHICTINWHETASYFVAVIIVTVVPCVLGSMFNFTKIFYWRMQYSLHKMKRKLSAANVEYLLDPAHRMSLVMFLVFWSSWIPLFAVHIYRYRSGEWQVPSVYVLWLGGSQGIWKFPIMMIFCPRYRQYLSNICCSKSITQNHFETDDYNLEYNSEGLQTLTDDTELHM